MFFTFPRTPAGMPSGRPSSSGSRSASTTVWCGACSNAYCRRRSPPRGAWKPYYLKRSCFESIAERKLRRRQLAEDGNVEITGRDLGYCWR